MGDHDPPRDRPAAGDDPTTSAGDGSTTSVQGTPVAVDTALDRRARVAIAVLLAGPVLWAAHFMLVYTVAEAGCTGGGPGLRLFDPPVPTVFTLAATVVAAIGCLGTGVWAYRRWRAGQRRPSAGESGKGSADREARHPGGSMALGGVLLSVLSFFSVLMVGLPALVLPC